MKKKVFFIEPNVLSFVFYDLQLKNTQHNHVEPMRMEQKHFLIYCYFGVLCFWTCFLIDKSWNASNWVFFYCVCLRFSFLYRLWAILLICKIICFVWNLKIWLSFWANKYKYGFFSSPFLLSNVNFVIRKCINQSLIIAVGL